MECPFVVVHVGCGFNTITHKKVAISIGPLLTNGMDTGGVRVGSLTCLAMLLHDRHVPARRRE